MNHPTARIDINPQVATVRPGKAGAVFAALAVLGALGCAGAWVVDARRFFEAYLTAYVWGATIVLGMLFFVLLHHVTDSGWSAVIRRPAEQTLAALPWLVLWFAPVAIGAASGKLFNWVGDHPHDELLAAKRPYLNLSFFFIRQAIYFAVWLWLARVMRGRSLRQDVTRDPRLSVSMRKWSAPGLILYGVTLTFAGFDWIMSLDYHWFSTIFGVYHFAGGVVTALAVLALMMLALEKRPLAGLVGGDVRHDLGKLWWAFVVFWGYIAFSQYFLVWYGNIPEETVWFLHRWTGTEAPFDSAWWMVSVAMPLGMFVAPFVVMMPASAKRSARVWVALGILALAMHWLDLWWMVMPVGHPHHLPLGGLWMDASALLAVGGVCGWATYRAMLKAPALPIHDPRLGEALAAGHHGQGDDEDDDDDDDAPATAAAHPATGGHP